MTYFIVLLVELVIFPRQVMHPSEIGKVFIAVFVLAVASANGAENDHFGQGQWEMSLKVQVFETIKETGQLF